MARIMRFAPTMLKNLFKKPVTTSYPETPIAFPEGSRGHIEIAVNSCIGCNLCAINCPSHAIKVNKNEGTWEISRMDCVQCGFCVTKCPKKCLSIVEGYTLPEREKMFESFQKDPEILAEERRKKAEAAKKAAEAKKAMAAKKAAEVAAKKAEEEAAKQ